MAWKDLRTIKQMPLGMALGTVSKMITGQDLNIKPRQLQKLKDEKLAEFHNKQEEEREKLFMVFANHFTAPEDVEEARTDFWGFVNYIYGTHTLRTYVNVILSYPDIMEALIEIYIKNETKIQELTYNLDRRTENVKAFGRAIEETPAQLAELIENFDGNSEKFIEDMGKLKAPVSQSAPAEKAEEQSIEHREEKSEASPDAENSAAEASVNNNDMKEAV